MTGPTNHPESYYIYDGITEALNDKGYNSKYNGIDVQIQNQYSDILNYNMRRLIRPLTVVIATINTYTITVTDASAVTAGNSVCMQQDTRIFQAKILSKNGNILTIDTPLDYTYTSGAELHECSFDLNVNGSTTPVIASIEPMAGIKFDIKNIIISMQHSTAGGDAVFGNLAELTKGIVLRKSNGIHHTIFNVKTNGQLASNCYDLVYTDRATPTQIYGTRARLNLSEHTGNVIRLDGNLDEKLELIIQDNLSSLNLFRVKVQGHIVED